MGAPPPDVIEREISVIRSAASGILREYEWAHEVGHTTGSSVGEHVKGGGTSDPTGALVASRSKGTTRNTTERAARLVVDARRALEGAESLLRRAIHDPHAFVDRLVEGEDR